MYVGSLQKWLILEISSGSPFPAMHLPWDSKGSILSFSGFLSPRGGHSGFLDLGLDCTVLYDF